MFKVNNIKLLLAIFVAFNFAKAQPIDYYSSIDFSKNGNALKVKLSQLISNTHTHNRHSLYFITHRYLGCFEDK